jgi:hypothetical protein
MVAPRRAPVGCLPRVPPGSHRAIVCTVAACLRLRDRFWRWGDLDARVAHCGGSAGALARLSVEYAMPGVVGVGLVHCSLSAEMEAMIRS